MDDSYQHEIVIDLASPEEGDQDTDQEYGSDGLGVLLLVVDIWHPTLTATQIRAMPPL